MQKATLNRLNKTETSTIGVLILPNGTAIHSMERPDKGNQRRVSCIPEGVYSCTRRKSPKFGWSYIINGVPDRDFILIHSANRAAQLQGCISFGKRAGMVNGVEWVFNSKQAVRELEMAFNYEPFILEIKYVGVPVTYP